PLPAIRYAVVRTVPLVGTVRGAICPLQELHVNILARDILNGGVGCLLKYQRLTSICDQRSRRAYQNASRGRVCGDRMMRAGYLGLWCAPGCILLAARCDPQRRLDLRRIENVPTV